MVNNLVLSTPGNILSLKGYVRRHVFWLLRKLQKTHMVKIMFEADHHWVHNCPDIFHSVCRQLAHFGDESSSYTFKLGFENT